MKKTALFLLFLSFAIFLSSSAIAQTNLLEEQGQNATSLCQPCTVDIALAPEAASIVPQISTAEMKKAILAMDSYIFDARPYKEFAIGHLPGALPLAAQKGIEKALYVSDLKHVQRIVKNRKDAPIIIYCNGIY